ncbi:MAG: hypothetical protein KatS3mg085_392 [Candidatus Dojkabacteria bacterium]|nr:MAG: hypothetical protein KatS3mg085_392 [Candidatus Dojkabacteria bacterium]
MKNLLKKNLGRKPKFFFVDKTKKAFTMIEIVVGLAVITVLVALGVTGISILQKNSRDSMRKEKLLEVATLVENYFRENLTYPSSQSLVFSGNQILLEGDIVSDIKGHLQVGDVTTSSQTRYYYQATSSGYALCAVLENNKVYSAGKIECPDPSMW